jgi:hypothetical protein
MDPTDLDQALERLRAASARAGANLLELDQSPSRALLAAARLEGLSAERWADAEEALAGLFQSYAALSAVIEAAVSARGTGATVPAPRRAELEQLLLGPSVELPERAVPIGERDLLSGSRTIRRCTPDQLLATMAQPFTVARTVIVTAGEAWDVGGPVLQSLREQLAALAECGELAIVEDDLAGAELRLERLEQTLVSDPLSFDGASVDALRAEVDTMVAASGDARRIRDDFAGEMASARVALAALQRAADDDQQEYPEVRARVVGVPRPPAIAFATLGDQLDRIAALAATGAWASVQAELGDWRRRLAIDQQQVQEHRAELQDLLERRRRLRGRLDAYTAKAAAVGCVEDEHLERLRHDAETLLYAAPADLEQAEDGLRRYQQALDTLMSARSGRAR